MISGCVDLFVGVYLILVWFGSMDYVYLFFLMISGVVWVNKDVVFLFIGCDDLIGYKGSVLVGSSLGEEFDCFVKVSFDLKLVLSLI